MAIKTHRFCIQRWLKLACVVVITVISQCNTSCSPALLAQSPPTGSHADNAVVVPECRISTLNQVSLACERAGVLDTIAQQGSIVKQGDVVAGIRDSITRASLQIAEKQAANDVEIRFAKKAGELAQLKYERAKSADRALNGTVTEFELRELRLAAERSLLQLQQAEQQFAIAHLRKEEIVEQLKSFQVSAPFDAYVRSVSKKPGEYLREGESVIELVNDEIMLAEGFVNYDIIGALSIGNEVDVYLDIPDNSGRSVFKGTLNFVDTKIDPISMKVKFSAHVKNRKSMLKDGFLTTIAISTNPQSRLSLR